jgi:hypothetical protein
MQQISKADAACHQLDMAITLWFQELDSVPIHTLACSAHQIVHDIIHHRGGHGPLFDSPYIKNEFRSFAKKCFHKHYNFFKHATHDPETFIEFNSSATEYFIVYCIFGLELLGIKHNLLRSAFMIFWGIHHPNLLTDEGVKFFINNIPSEQLDEIRNLTRQQFVESFSSLTRQK